MAKLRVNDLARELGVKSNDVLAELEKAGMAAKSHSSGMTDEQAEFVKKKFGGGASKPAPKKPKSGAARPVRPVIAEPKAVRHAPVVVDDEAPVMPPPAAKRAAKMPEPAAKPHKTAVQDKPGRVKPKPPEPPKAPEPPVVEVESKPEAPAPVAKEEPPVITVEETPAPPEQVSPTVVEAPRALQEVTPPPAPAEQPVASPPVSPQVSIPPRPPMPPMPKEGAPRPPIQGGQSPALAAPKEGDAKFKKPKVKGPKPLRPELEVLEGVERMSVIPAKLKERLQPVKKSKAGAVPDTTFVKREAEKWAPPKGGGKKFKGGGNKYRPQYRQEKVEDQGPAVVRKKAIKITEGLTIKDFAEKIGQKAGEILKKLIEMGTMATINQPIDPDAAVLIADTYGLKLEVAQITDEEAFVEEEIDKAEDLITRPPVVTIMGHVDHGKTSLLDAIRKTNVTGGEAGGITQHIGAYKVRLNDRDIVFLDTPGHEAFTAMRARGAQVTDIVVLVVAADDGVMPQTIEAVNHSKAAKVPIIVAVNKIDKPEADQDRVKRELSDHGLVPEEWGGDTIYAAVSAKKQIGLEALLEMILLQADIMDMKANPNKPGRGTIIEAKLDKGRGPVATVLVSSGTIRPGDAFVTGQHFGRIRMLLNDKGKKEKEAGPATPVEVIGLSGVPQSGDAFVVMEDEKKARMVAQSRMQKQREADLALRKRVTLDDLFTQIQKGDVKELNIIIKADVQGSVEAVSESLLKLSTEAVKLKVIHGSVGAITESDVMLASASNAIIIGFNIRPEPKASALAESEGVDVRLYNIIYNAIDEVRAAMEGLLEPTLKEKVTGRAEVRQTFSVPKIGTIAGAYMLDGLINRSCAGVRVLRDNVVVYEGKLGSLRRFKDDVKEVLTGYECGIGIENFNDLKIGDVIEAYIIEKTVTKL